MLFTSTPHVYRPRCAICWSSTRSCGISQILPVYKRKITWLQPKQGSLLYATALSKGFWRWLWERTCKAWKCGTAWSLSVPKVRALDWIHVFSDCMCVYVYVCVCVCVWEWVCVCLYLSAIKNTHSRTCTYTYTYRLQSVQLWSVLSFTWTSLGAAIVRCGILRGLSAADTTDNLQR